MWYPEDLDRRPLQISFMLDLKPRQSIHETALIPHVHELREFLYPYYGEPVNGSIAVDGSISMVFQGRELLGPDYWFEFIVLSSLNDLVEKNVAHVEHFGQTTRGFLLTPTRDGRVLFEIERPDRNRPVQAVLPRVDLIREWNLMLLRLHRITAELGRASSIAIRDDPLSAFGGKALYLDLIGRERIVYTAETPLEQLLADPVPF